MYWPFWISTMVTLNFHNLFSKQLSFNQKEYFTNTEFILTLKYKAGYLNMYENRETTHETCSEYVIKVLKKNVTSFEMFLVWHSISLI